MRLLELILFLSSAFLIFLIPLRQRINKKVITTSIIVISVIFSVHLIVENFRWQMVPLYGALSTVVLYFFLTSNNLKNEKYRYFRIMIYNILILLFIGSIFPPYLFPVFELPEPTGNYSVGTKYFVVTDSSRMEYFTENPEDLREISIQAYYPAIINNNSNPEPYWYDSYKWSEVWTKKNGFGFFPYIWSHLGLVKTHCYPNAETVKNNKFPVLIFSHGYGQLAKFNTSLLEDLASKGYVVLSISHNYETPFTIYPDKSIRSYSQTEELEIKRNEESKNPKVTQVLKNVYYEKDDLIKKELYKELYKLRPIWFRSNLTWSDDIIFCINKLKKINNDHLVNIADTTSIGVLGFSFGGGAAGYAALIDKRIKAGVNLDGWQYGHQLDENLTIPFMFMTSENHKNANAYFIKRAESTVYDFTLLNSRHANFNDMSLAVELPGKMTGKLGSVDASFGLKVIKQYVNAFFEKHLKQKENYLLRNNETVNNNIIFKVYNDENEY